MPRESVPKRCTLPSRLSELRSQPPRPLTTEELARLHNLGFDTLARYLAAGTCPRCKLNKAGRTHKELCVDPKRPLTAEPAPVQPWEPKPPRHLRQAA